MVKEKPIVFYCPNPFYRIQTGLSALVVPTNHYSELVSNEKHVLTSKVIRHEPETGEFETLNTIYKRVPASDLH